MERIYAFTDESGAFGWDLDNPSVSTHFVISAIIVEESKLQELRVGVEQVRKKYFQVGEMKSSKVGNKHDRRKRILADLLPLPFSIFAVVVDKRLLTDSLYRGVRYKETFYKFMNNIVHKELCRAFSVLTIVADEVGGSEYMKSFSNYVERQSDIPNMFGEANFLFQNSESDVLIQLADFISGTFAREYDVHRKTQDTPAFHKMLEKKIIRIEQYPKTIENYVVESSAIAEKYDKTIARLCFNRAAEYIAEYENREDDEEKARVIVLQYLLFRFMNNDLRTYISTRELKNQLKYTGLASVSTQTFRTRIIGVLRDRGVIISSSSTKKGYKIPANEAELFEFMNHGTTIIMPMLERMKKCRDLIKLGTNNELDLFGKTEYAALKKYFES